MNLFLIDAENHVTAFAATSQVSVPKGGYKFASATELATLAAGWPVTRLVEIWNKLPKVSAVRRFTDRKTAVRRIWGALQEMEPSSTAPSHKSTADRGKKPTKTVRVSGRDGTKTERMIALLKRPSGATLNELMAETGWQPHSVRGFISGQLSKRLGFRIKSFKRAGDRVYRIQ
ncbi:MAG: DUF3489 domain-containing protein [Bryobacteraceae bacterium]|jgi:hypothetical protein